MTDRTGPPRVGRPAPYELIGRCRYSPTLHQPACLTDATHHGVIADRTPPISFAACQEHKPIIELLCTHLHEFDSPCELPGSEFLPDENRCVMPELNHMPARVAEKVASE